MRTLILLLLPLFSLAQLPSSGSLSLKSAAGVGRSISQQVDGNETGSKSLTTLSTTASKTAPHSMLEFYGYPAGPGLPGSVTGCTASIPSCGVLTGINLAWVNPASGGTPEGTVIKVSVNGGAYSTLTTVAYPGTTYTHTDAALANGSTYAYTFEATNASGNGAACGPTSAVYYPNTPNAATTFLAASEYGTGINLTWNAPASGETPAGYSIMVDINGDGSYETSFAVCAPSTSTTYTSVTVGTTYRFSIQAYTAGGYSSSLLSNFATYSAPVAPGSPSSVVAANAGPSISITWNAPASGGTPTNYRVERSVNGGAWSLEANTGTTTSTSDVNVLVGNDYQYRVRAENSGGNSSYVTSNTVSY